MLKIKGTDLDRSKKLTSEDIAWCKQMKKEGYTYTQIGKVFNVTGPCIRYNLISTKERRELNDKKNAAKRNWWHSLPKEKMNVPPPALHRMVQSRRRIFSQKKGEFL